MAEGVGFEPTEACDLSGFQDRCNKPLYHPSKFSSRKSSVGRGGKSRLGLLPRKISLSEDLIALPLEYGRGALVVIDMKD